MSAGSMLYGAAPSVVAAALLVAFVGTDRGPRVLVTVGLAAFVMPIWWNLILRWTGATGAFSHDRPFPPFPVSWQDTGSGVVTRAWAAITLTVGVRATEPAGRVGRTAMWTALGAFLIDSTPTETRRNLPRHAPAARVTSGSRLRRSARLPLSSRAASTLW
jgi:hypothetical protein